MSLNENGISATRFEALGKRLQEAMSTYTSHLRQENLPLPSFTPSLKPSLSKSVEATVSRKAIVDLAQEICAMTMDPATNLLISSLQFHFCSSLKVVIDLQVQNHVPEHGKISIQELAMAVNADESLLRRVMRLLTNKHIFSEPIAGYYSHTAMSWMITDPDMYHLLSHRLDEPFRASSRQADALALSGYQDPTSDDPYGFQLAFDTDETFWEYITNQDPDRGQRFGRAMRAVTLNTLNVIPTMYPFDRLVRDGGVLVDVGGGLGQVGKLILSHYPGVGLKCVVQDKFADNSSGPLRTGVQLQRHDFFEPQPIRGAAAYFFRHIFHDWPDCACIKILRHTAYAMSPEHSRLLICDQIVDEVNPSLPSMLYDIDMMTLFGGKERTLTEWKALLKAADERLFIRDITTASGTTIIEVRISGSKDGSDSDSASS